MRKISKDGKMTNTKNKRRSAEFYFSRIFVLGAHMEPGGYDSDCKLVPNSLNISILGRYKGNSLDYDMSCV